MLFLCKFHAKILKLQRTRVQKGNVPQFAILFSLVAVPFLVKMRTH